MWFKPCLRQRNHYGKKSRDKIGGKEMFFLLLLYLKKILLFGCLFVRFLVAFLIAFFLSFFLFFFIYFVIICPVPECSGMSMFLVLLTPSGGGSRMHENFSADYQRNWKISTKSHEVPMSRVKVRG